MCLPLPKPLFLAHLLTCAGADTATFHETSINDTIAILAQEGKYTGVNVYPYSTTSLVAS